MQHHEQLQEKMRWVQWEEEEERSINRMTWMIPLELSPSSTPRMEFGIGFTALTTCTPISS